MKIIENALGPDQLAIVEAEIASTAGWDNYRNELHEEVAGGVVVDAVSRTHTSNQLVDLVRSAIVHHFPQYRRDNMRVLYHKLDTGGGLGLHSDDSNCTFAATLYLNKKWEPNWGGFLLWNQGGSVWQGVLPTYNMLVLNDEFERHLVTPVTPAAETSRISLQVFGTTLGGYYVTRKNISSY